MAWLSRVALKHLMTTREDYESVQADMNAVADVLATNAAFWAFDRNVIAAMRAIPEGDAVFTPVDYANRLLDRMYDFADAFRIWID